MKAKIWGKKRLERKSARGAELSFFRNKWGVGLGCGVGDCRDPARRQRIKKGCPSAGGRLECMFKRKITGLGKGRKIARGSVSREGPRVSEGGRGGGSGMDTTAFQKEKSSWKMEKIQKQELLFSGIHM